MKLYDRGRFNLSDKLSDYLPWLQRTNKKDMTSDQQHTIFQMPFGAAARYQFNRGGAWQPYVGVKLGTEYAKVRSNYNVFESRDENWGFYVSPEVGLNVYPWAYGPGLHLALYYSYGTNKADKVLTYSVDKLNNFGFRVGLSF